MSPTDASCSDRAAILTQASDADGFSVELERAQLETLPGSLEVEVRYCEAGACATTPGLLTLGAYEPGGGISGSFSLERADSSMVEGELSGEWCDWSEHVSAPNERWPVSGLTLSRLAIYQAVKVPIMEQGIELLDRNADVVAGRRALLRAYVSPRAEWTPRTVLARLSIGDEAAPDDGVQVLEQTMLVGMQSVDANLDSTFNFSIPESVLHETTSYSVELLEAEACAGAHDESDVAEQRFPVEGTLSLNARDIGSVKVVVVPVHVQQGADALVPDTSANQIELNRREIMKLFPVDGVEISVRAPVATTAAEMVDVLDEIAALRDAENSDPTVTYYGLVNLAPTLGEYCFPNCVLGASFNGENLVAGVGVGIGFSGAEQARTFTHELGHVHGRVHTPCGVPGDPLYPYSEGRIGSWGYDVLDGMLIEPNSHKDFMGYCTPVWVSDYVFRGLQDFIGGMNRAGDPLPSPLSEAAPPRRAQFRFRTLIVEPHGSPRWGRVRSMLNAPRGKLERALAMDSAGRAVATVDVYRFRVDDLGVEMFYVPSPASSDWVSIRVAGLDPVRWSKH